MTDPSPFNTPIRREEDVALCQKLVSRLRQHGITLELDTVMAGELADLLTAVDDFEDAVERAGGDLFVDSPDSSEPERPDLVLPHPHMHERVDTYTKRVIEATRRLEQRTT